MGEGGFRVGVRVIAVRSLPTGSPCTSITQRGWAVRMSCRIPLASAWAEKEAWLTWGRGARVRVRLRVRVRVGVGVRVRVGVRIRVWMWVWVGVDC